jgi:hypothetical protein
MEILFQRAGGLIRKLDIFQNSGYVRTVNRMTAIMQRHGPMA